MDSEHVAGNVQQPSKPNDRVYKAEEEIRQMILSGEIMPGDAFPPERVLAEKLGVSRNTVREAYNSLDALGIIETVHGSGRYLRENANLLARVFDTRQLVERYTNKELAEARQVLEVGIASLAASRATREDKILLQENVRAMKAIVESGAYLTEKARFTRLDYQFHYYLAVISNNSILREIITALEGTIQKATISIQRPESASPEAYHWHSEILSAVCDNDPDRASYAMTQHLASFEEMLYKK